MSTFGKLYRVTTYGESHCKSVGCIVDGCPPGLTLTNEDIQVQLSRRRPGQSDITTPVSSRATRMSSGLTLPLLYLFLDVRAVHLSPSSSSHRRSRCLTSS